MSWGEFCSAVGRAWWVLLLLVGLGGGLGGNAWAGGQEAMVFATQTGVEELERTLAESGFPTRQRLEQAVVIAASEAELVELERRGMVVHRLSNPARLALEAGQEIDLGARARATNRRGDRQALEGWVVAYSGVWTPERSEALKELGARLVGPLPPAAWLVRAREDQLPAFAALPWVVAVAAQEASWKISPLFRHLPVDPERATVRVKVLLYPDADRSDLLDFVGRHSQRIEQSEGVAGWMVGADLSVDVLDELGAFPALAYIEPQTRGQLFNNSIRVVMQTERQHLNGNQDFYNPIFGLGIFGEGQTVAIADTGLRTSHEQFASAGSRIDGPHGVVGTFGGSGLCLPDGDDPFSHGTPVANTLAGDSKDSGGQLGSVNGRDGLALKANLYVQDITYDPAGGGDPLLCDYGSIPNQILKPAYDAGARVHNNSWGHMSGPGFSSGLYTLETRELDEWIYQHPDSVQVFAVGNTGGYWVWDYAQSYWYVQPVANTLSDEAHAKNVIAVGGSRDADNRHHMYLFSSRGPTANEVQGPACHEQGRVKPDLLAPASTTIESAETSGNSTYCPLSICPYGYFGTSHAAPAISAAAALVRDYFAQPKYPNDAKHPQIADRFKPSAALVKAMLVNSTVFLKDASAYAASQLASAQCTPDSYPNFDQGYGRPALDTVLEPAGYRQLRAYEDDTDVVTQTDPVKATQVGQGGLWTVTPKIKDVWASRCNVLRVTLAWTDPAPTLPASKVLVNDLDLEVLYKGQTYRGNHHLTQDPGAAGAPVWDRLNNVEDIFVPLGAQPSWSIVQPTIRVYGAQVPLAPQKFAVVLTYGPCFDNTPCPTQPTGGCYHGPGDTVPGTHPPPVDGGQCQSQDYSYNDCPDCGQGAWPSCSPPNPVPGPVLCKPLEAGRLLPAECQN